MTHTITNTSAPKNIDTKYGLKKKFGLQLSSHGEKWFDCWMGRTTQGWINGTELTDEEFTIEEREYNGKTYYTIKPVSSESRLEQRIVALEERVDKMAAYLKDKA